VQADRFPREEAAKIGLSTSFDVWFRQDDAAGPHDAIRPSAAATDRGWKTSG
jgi:hypothetical protein